jgi:phage host-nuclease inhibitor protein Gam
MKSPSHARSPKRAIHDYRKSFREKTRLGKRQRKRGEDEILERTVPSEQQVFEVTIKRLHTLGTQKFASSPFSEHFERWLSNVEAVLDEFEANPNITVDEEYTRERSQALSAIKLQLDNRKNREAQLEKQISSLQGVKSQLQQVDIEYQTKVVALKGQKAAALKRLNKEIEVLKKEQDHVIKQKTGFLRGISKKERERQEIDVVQRLGDKQQELEVLVMDFRERLKLLREEFERKREPIVEMFKLLRKCVREMDEDGSLEERWFACEALIDAVNGVLQRKADI